MRLLSTLIVFFSFLALGHGQLIINEVLYDPPDDIAGDANGDGTRDPLEDEFLEIYNDSGAMLDVSGYKIFDAQALDEGVPRHIFPDGSEIPAGGVVVVFGGGTPTGEFGGSLVQTASGGQLNMNNSGDFMTITNANDDVLAEFDIEPLSNNPNESYTRNPDITGEFEQHNDNFDVLFSPGTMVDGMPFISDVPVESIAVEGEGGATEITEAGGSLQISATVMPENATDPSVTWSLEPASGIASIDANGLLTAEADGSVTVTATANDGSGVSGSAVIEISNQSSGIDEVESGTVELYPNPVLDELTIKADGRILEMTIFNLTGQVVRVQTNSDNTILVGDLNEGVYIISIRTSEGTVTSRFVKIN